MPGDYSALAQELKSADLVGLTDLAAAQKLDTDTVQVTVSRTLVSSYEIIGATVPAEWAALTANEKQRYQTLTGAGMVDVSNPNVQNAFAAMFAAGTTTRTQLLALTTETVIRTRAEAISGWDMLAYDTDVAYARSLP